MSYQRFVLQVPPATVATPATLRTPGTPTVADVASVAEHGCKSPPNDRLTEVHGAEIRDLLDNSDRSLQQTAAVQRNTSCCHVCARPFSIDDAVIAVLTGKPDQRFWLHHACHDEHIRRCIAERNEVPVISTAGLQ